MTLDVNMDHQAWIEKSLTHDEQEKELSKNVRKTM